MTPEEKALELIDKMYHYQWREKQRAKECALIAVDEVIESLHEHHWQNRLIIDYWKEVKQEIEKL
jgi:thymidylate synthase